MTSAIPPMSTALNSTTDSTFMNTLIQELNAMKLNNNCSLDLFGDSNSINNVSASNYSNQAKQNAWGGKQPSPISSLWRCSPQSPSSSSSNRTQYHSASSHSNSKESLWTSNQSSPNSNLRDNYYSSSKITSSNQISSSQITNLWENPVTKMSQVALMCSRDSMGSIWATPPPPPPPSQSQQPHPQPQPPQGQASPPGPVQMQPFLSNANAKINNVWEMPSTQKIADFTGGRNQPAAQAQIGRPYDILGDLWTNGGSGGGSTVGISPQKIIKEPLGSLWTPQPPPPHSNYSNFSSNQNCNGNVISNKSALIKGRNSSPPMAAGAPAIIPSAAAGNCGGPVGGYYPQTQAQTAQTAASSSCLQLFSDEFLNYLNMIN